jgi:L-threonylcarbamoyladenylate synthase
MTVYRATEENIMKAADIIKSGGLVSFPTETVYGLAANAFDPVAVAKIFKVKERPTFDPLIVHTSSLEKANKFVDEIPEKACKLADKFWPGPLTLILKKTAIIPDIVTSGLDTVAVRVPNHPLTLKLLKSIDFPLAAPSANPFGYVSPTSAAHVNEQLGDKIEYVLDGGDCQIGIESTIVEFDDEEVTILRLGGCKIEDIEASIGKVILNSNSSSNPVAPGMMESHYSPLTPIVIGDIDELIVENSNKKIGILSFKTAYESAEGSHQFILSEKGDIDEAATRLFTGLRKLDSLNLQLIVSEYVPDEGLGKAINDRLKRAEAKRN